MLCWQNTGATSKFAQAKIEEERKLAQTKLEEERKLAQAKIEEERAKAQAITKARHGMRG